MSQREALEFLASPSSSGGLPVRRIDTHAASVFLSGSRALKVKRAVKFPFLDYSTLALRKQACLAEIEVNRPFAPELYEGLARITREADGSLQIGGQGEVVEWAVQMRRFDEALTLDRYAVANEITPEMARTIVTRLAQVHKSASRQNPDVWIAALESFLEQHNKVFRDHPALFPAEKAESLLENARQWLSKSAELIRRRSDGGLLVRGHGDLHLGNIALVKGEPVIFDAVEFDPVIASGDVLYDLAFLLMDLWTRGQAAAANAALNGYLEAANRDENIEGLRLLPLFLSVRGAIRAIVAAARFDQKGEEADARAAKLLFDSASDFLVPVAPVLVAVGGLSGTGKSYLAKRMAPRIPPAPGAVVLRSDVKRKALAGVNETVRLSRSSYTDATSRKVYEAICADAARALAAGHSVILDAVFSTKEERAAAERVAANADVPFHGIFLHAGLADRVRRVAGRAHDASDADRNVVIAQEAYRIDDVSWARIDSSSDPDSTLAAAIQSFPPTFRQRFA